MQQSHLLIVDNNRSVLKACERVLRRPELSISIAASLAAARAVAEAHSPDVVLVDVDVGAESGIGFARTLWSAQPGLPVIFMSGGLPLDCARVPGFEGHWCRFIAKPFGALELRAIVAEAASAAVPPRPCRCRSTATAPTG